MKNNINKALNWRYATKTFDSSKKISNEDWSVIEESLIQSPSSFGLQPWKFLVITNPEVRKELTPHSWHQSQVEDCSHFLVICAKKEISQSYVEEYIESAASIRDLPVSSFEDYKIRINHNMELKGKDKINYTARQAYIALGFSMFTASLLEIDACPMEGFFPEEYNRILQIDAQYTAVVACAFGFRSKQDKYSNLKKVRFDKTKLIEYIS